MTFEATIENVHKQDDELIIDVEFSDGKTSFMKSYPWVHMIDINTNFITTIKGELKRMNDLQTGYTALKERIGEKITAVSAL